MMHLTPLQRTLITMSVVVASCLCMSSTVRAQPAFSFTAEARCPISHINGLTVSFFSTTILAQCLNAAGGSTLQRTPANYESSEKIVKMTIVCQGQTGTAQFQGGFGVLQTTGAVSGACSRSSGASTLASATIHASDPPEAQTRVFLTVANVLTFLGSLGIGWWYSNKPKGGVLD
jgi:hypothetical protein